MTLVQLSYIVAVDNYKSFAIAAKKCFITQPTLSMQIQKLENELDILIFDRSKYPIKPTDIGRKIIDQARVILRESRRINDLINEQSNEISGDFRLGIIPTIAPYLLPVFIESFVEKYDKLNLVIDEIQTDQIIDKLRKDELDAGILATPLYIPEIKEDPLFYEPFVGYISKKHELFKKERIEVNDLNLSDLWLLKEGHCFRDHVIQICKKFNDSNNKDLKINFEAGTMETLMKLVENNFGITLIPYLLAEEIVGTDRATHLRPLNEPVPKREISIIYQRAHLKKKVIDLLKKEIVDSIPSHLRDRDNSFVVETVL